MADLIRRVSESVLVILGVVTVVFVIIRLAPGDPSLLLLPDGAPARMAQELRHSWGFDQPIHIQYFAYLRHIISGDLGKSIFRGIPAAHVVLERLPLTVVLALASIVLSVFLAILLGTLAASIPNSTADYVLRLGAFLGQAIPGFWLGLMLMLVFSVMLHWLPTSGSERPESIILPTVTLTAYLCTYLLRVVRGEVLDALGAAYVRTARAKGLRERYVLLRHVLRNALLPIITIIGLQLGTVLSGAIVVEAVFAWPGLGQLMVQAIQVRDYPVVQATVLITATFVTLVNQVTDALYHWVDPRTRAR